MPTIPKRSNITPFVSRSRGTVLLTGAAGFVGSHLTDRLLAEGHRVIGVDNFITGSHANLAHLAREPRFELIEHDVSQPLEIAGDLEWVMHFASPASPPKYLKWPLQTLAANSYGTHRLLELARRKRATFFLASTSEVYGDALEHPQNEDYWGNVNPNGPRSIYDESKRYAEAVTMSYRREWRQPVRVVRIFNTYGRRMDAHDGRVVTNFVRQALLNEPLTVYGEGLQTRCLQHVDDLVEGIVRMMRVDYQDPLNLGNPEELCMLDLAKMVLELTSGRSEIVYAPLPDDDPKRRRPDITRAIELLGWYPTVHAVQGLADVIEYFSEILGPATAQVRN